MSSYKVVGGASFFPITLQLEIVIAALRSIMPELDESRDEPQVQNVCIHSPIFVKGSSIWLDVKATDSQSQVWSWTIGSSPPQTTGKVVLRARNNLEFHAEFARHERLIRHQRCLNLLNSKDTDDVIQGRNIYKTYAEIIDCGSRFRGLQKIVGRDDESAGVIAAASPSNKWLDAGLTDVICQAASIFANCMTERPDSTIFIPGGIEQWFRSPRPRENNVSIKSWHVFATHHWEHEAKMVSNLFVFEAHSGELLEVILGVEYRRVSKVDFSKGGITPHKSTIHEYAAPPNQAEYSDLMISPSAVATAQTDATLAAPVVVSALAVSTDDIAKRVIGVLASISGLTTGEIKNDTGLADIGIDSLMGMELARDLDEEFECSLNLEDLNEVVDV
jgi:acyl carrier protein